MKCNQNGRFANEHVYLQTVCRKRKPPQKRRCDNRFLECTLCLPCARLTVCCDKNGDLDARIDINSKPNKPPKND